MTQIYIITLLTALLFIAPNDAYFAGPSDVSWEDAEAYCESQASTLASIHSESDREAASSVCETTGDTWGCHIGLRMFNGAWEWIDGSALNYGFNNGDGSSVVVPPWFNTVSGDGAGGEECGYIYGATDPYTFEDIQCSGRNDNYGLNPPICNGAPTTVSASGYTVRDAGSISCGETKEGTRSTGDDMPVYSYTAVSDQDQVFLEGCNSVHDIWLYLFDGNGQIYNADDQRNHGDQGGCGNWFAGDITVTTSGNAPNPVSVSAGDTYYFGIGSWASTTGDYSVYLDCSDSCSDIEGSYIHNSEVGNSYALEAIISRTSGSTSITIDMSSAGRPDAYGSATSFSGDSTITGSVYFPDDTTYSFYYYPCEGKIYWGGSGTNIWVKVDDSGYPVSAQANKINVDWINFNGNDPTQGGFKIVTNAAGYMTIEGLVIVLVILLCINIGCYCYYINYGKNDKIRYKSVSYETDTDAC